jgi:hypothetical protein
MKLNLFRSLHEWQLISSFFVINKFKILKSAGLIILLTFVIHVGVSPLHKINEFKRLVRADSLFVEQYDSVYNHPDLESLVKERSYKQALLKLSEQDSIQLIINLHDSIVCLSIKGVIIHETHINNFKDDKVLKKLPNMEYVKLFSQALKIQSQWATIVKEPIVVRNAPKDTAEAALNAYQPDTLIQKPAFMKLELDHGIHIIFEQDLNPTFKHKFVRFIFKAKINVKNIYKEIFHFIRFQKSEYNPTIVIKMPADDLRAIYRAFPTNAYVVLNINT